MSQTMLYGLVSLFLTIRLVSSTYVRWTKFQVVQEHHLGNRGIECASSIQNVSFVAAKQHGTSGDCEGLTWQWGENKEYMTDYAYIEKTVLTEIYTPPLVHTLKKWLQFNVSNGGKVEIAFTIPDDTEDKFDLEFATADDVIEHIPVRLRFERSTEEATMLSYNGRFTPHEVISPFTISIGVPHIITIRILETDIKVFFDNTLLSRYTPTVSPACSRLLRVKAASVHNVTFEAG